MHNGYAEQLREIESKELAWRVLSISLAIILLVAMAVLVSAGFIKNGGNTAIISAAIYMPILASLPFIVNHWHKLRMKKEALAHYVKNADRASEIFYQLLERHISGGIGQFFGEMGLTGIKVILEWSSNNDFDIAVSGRKDRSFIRAVFGKTGFSLDVDEDEEKDGKIMIQYPGSNSLSELSGLMGAEIDRRIRKNGKQ